MNKKILISVLLIIAFAVSSCAGFNGIIEFPTTEEAMTALAYAEATLGVLNQGNNVEVVYVTETAIPSVTDEPSATTAPPTDMIVEDTVFPTEETSDSGVSTPSETIVGTATPIPNSTSTITQTPNKTATATKSASNTPTMTGTPLSVSNTSTTVPKTNTPKPASTNTSVPASSGCSPSSDSSIESQIISLINGERQKNGLAALSSQSQLSSAARTHSQDMACNNFFSHDSPTTGSPFARIGAAGYSYSWAGENIAAGYGSAGDVVTGWMNSSGHRDNILNSNFTQIGVSYVSHSGSAYGTYITAVFAKP